MDARTEILSLRLINLDNNQCWCFLINMTRHYYDRKNDGSERPPTAASVGYTGTWGTVVWLVVVAPSFDDSKRSLGVVVAGLGGLDRCSWVPVLLQPLFLLPPDVLAHALVHVRVLRVRLDHVPAVFPQLINLGTMGKKLHWVPLVWGHFDDF